MTTTGLDQERTPPGADRRGRCWSTVAAEFNRRMAAEAAASPELTDEQLAAARESYGALSARWPDALRGSLIDYHLTCWRTALHETANLDDEVYDELRRGGGVPDVPLIVLTAAGDNPALAGAASAEQLAAVKAGIHTLHASIAAAVPSGEHRLLDGASHQFLHIECEDEIVTAITDVLARAAP